VVTDDGIPTEQDVAVGLDEQIRHALVRTGLDEHDAARPNVASNAPLGRRRMRPSFVELGYRMVDPPAITSLRPVGVRTPARTTDRVAAGLKDVPPEAAVAERGIE